jgi:hypothetical protein
MIGRAINSQAAPAIKATRAILPSDIFGIRLLSARELQFYANKLAVAFEGHAELFESLPQLMAASVARMSKATSGADLSSIDPACRSAHAGYLLQLSHNIK